MEKKSFKEEYAETEENFIKNIKDIFTILFILLPKNLYGTFKSLFIEAKTEKHSSLFNTSKNIIIALIIATIIRTFICEPFHIPSGSMKPGLIEGDYIFVTKYDYGWSRYSFPFNIKLWSGKKKFSQPKRGDVIVFKLPSNPSIHYIKRLIGLPGDKIQLKDGFLYINSQKIDKRYFGKILEYENKKDTEVDAFEENIGNKYYNVLDKGYISSIDDTDEYIIPSNHYFFLGDNRDNSLDSRYSVTGFVHEDYLIGKAKIIFLSSRENPLKFWKWKHIIRWTRIFKIIK